jgi:putative exporter of polyketide antibiotics
LDYDFGRESARVSASDEGRMLGGLMRALVKVVVASLIVGTILAHFGITINELMKAAGLSPDRIAELARSGVAWAVPNLMLGAVVIVPLWFLLFLFRPPGESRD